MRHILKHITLAIAIAASLAVVTTSCNNDNCIGNSTGIPLAGFYRDNNAVTLTNLTVYGIGAPNDSLIINKASAKNVYLPLRLSTSSCKYVFNYNTEGLSNDTLTLGYEAIPYFESHECGAMYNFRITSMEHTTHAIDSVIISEPLITNADVVSIKIHVQ